MEPAQEGGKQQETVCVVGGRAGGQVVGAEKGDAGSFSSLGKGGWHVMLWESIYSTTVLLRAPAAFLYAAVN